MNEKEDKRMSEAQTTATDIGAGAGDWPRIDSASLMRGSRRLVIVHNDHEYVLQVTRSGRLILTK